MTAPTLVRRPPTPLAESLAQLETLVSPYTGVVRVTYEVLCALDDARLVRIGSDASDGDDLVGAPLAHIREGSGGSAPRRDAATAAAIAEIAERYSLSHVPRELVLATAEELASAVAPAKFALFHDRQHATPGFPFARFTSSTRVRWTRGFRLPDLAPAYLPAQLVYLDRRPREDEQRIGYGTSNGAACGPSFEEALLAALLEVVERDAFMITWYGRLSLPRLDWHDDEALREHDERYFAPTRLRYAAIDLSPFLDVPTVLGVVRGNSVGLGVGAGCAPTVEIAWRKALAEAFAVRSWGRVQRLERPQRDFGDDFADVRTFADHVCVYADPARATLTSFLDASSETRVTSDVAPLEGDTPADHVHAIARRLGEQGITAYAVDVTAPDVRDAGLVVVKAVVPELCALDVDHRARFLGGTRLYEAAWRRGLAGRPLRYDELNPYPHPFP